MKKIKFLLLAMTVLALLVATLSVTVFADDSQDALLTINGEAAEDGSEIPDNATVVVYGYCALIYNDTASYSVGQDAAVNAAYISYQEYDFPIIYFMTLEDIAAYTNESIPCGDEIMVFAPTEGVAYFENATYTVGENSGIDYAYMNFKNNTVDFKALTDDAANFKADLNGGANNTANKADGFAIKLFNNVSTSDSALRLAQELQGTADKHARFYFDLNGYSFTNVGNSYRDATFSIYKYPYKDINIISSRPGGAIYNFGKNGSTVSAAPFCLANFKDANLNIGKSYFGGREIAGENLTMCMANLVSHSGGVCENNVITIDGATFISATANSEYPTVYTGRYNNNTKVIFKNAFLYSASGRFFTSYAENSAEHSAIEVDSCVFYSGALGQKLFALNTTTKLSVSNSVFTCPISIGYATNTNPASFNADNVKFDNCIVAEGAAVDCSIAYKDAEEQNQTFTGFNPSYVANLGRKIHKDYSYISIPGSFSLNEDGTLGFVKTALGAVDFDRAITDVAFYHNITLTSDLLYNVYISKALTDIKVNGVAKTVRSYDATRNVIQISVPAMKALDELVITGMYGEEEVTLNTSAMKYVDSAKSAYASDALLVNLLDAIKDYAKAASDYANYNVAAFDYEYSQVLTTEENSGVRMPEVSETFKSIFTGAKLRLDGEVAFVFTVAPEAIADVTFDYSYGGEARQQVLNVAGMNEVVIKVKAVDLKSNIKATIGNESVDYSFKNYVYDMSSGENKTNAKLMALLAYVDNYCTSARELLCPGHEMAPSKKENVIEKTEVTHGSYDLVNYCIYCGNEMQRRTILERVPLGDYFVEANGEGTYRLTGVRDKTMTEAYIPDSVTEIAEGAFAGCSSLVKIDLPFVGASGRATESSEATVFGYIFGKEAFDGASATSQTYKSGVAAIYYIPDSITTVSIRGGNLYSGEFYNCKNIKHIIIGDGITYLGSNMAYNTAKLEYIIIPTSIVGVRQGASLFRAGGSSEIIYVSGPKEELNWPAVNMQQANGTTPEIYAPVYYYSENEPTENDGSFWHYVDGVPTVWPTSFEIENLIEHYTYTKTDAGYTITGLTDKGKALGEINVPEGVVAVGEYAFKGTTATKVTLPSTLKTVEANAFRACHSIREIDFSQCQSGLYIGNSAFYNIDNAGVTIRIPNISMYLGGSNPLRFVKKANIEFAGTKAEWKANIKVKSGSNIIDASPINLYGSGFGTAITINCTDGVLEYDATTGALK